MGDHNNIWAKVRKIPAKYFFLEILMNFMLCKPLGFQILLKPQKGFSNKVNGSILKCSKYNF